MRLVSVRLRDPSLTIPCPTRKRNIVDGDVVDLDRPYWRRIAREGDIIEAAPTPASSED